MPKRRPVRLPVLLGRRRAGDRAGYGVVRDRGLAAGRGRVVREAMARSHDPVRIVARSVWPADLVHRRVASPARSVVAAAHNYVDGPAFVAVALLHSACLPARGSAWCATPQARHADPQRPDARRCGGQLCVRAGGKLADHRARIAGVLADTQRIRAQPRQDVAR